MFTHITHWLYRSVTSFAVLMVACALLPLSALADTIFLPVVHTETMVVTGVAATTVTAVAQLKSGTDPVKLASKYGVMLVESLPGLSLYRFQGTATKLFTNLASSSKVVAIEADQNPLAFDAQQRLFDNGETVVAAQQRLTDTFGNDFQALQHYFSFKRGGPDPMNTVGAVEQALVADATQVFDEAWRTWGLQRSAALTAQTSATGAGVIVAVLDTGVEPNHPALAGRLLPGYDFVDNDNLPSDIPDGTDHDGDGLTDEAVGHGTHVAGVVATVAPQAQILPIRVLHSDGGGVLFDIVQGIAYAVEHGAKVINLSFSATAHSPTLEAAINYALNHQVVVVVAASGNGAALHYPAAYPGVIAVGAIQKDGLVAEFSAAYASLVDVFAPGEMIYSAYYNSGYAWWSGSSMAAPFVSGEAALLIEKGGCVPECIVDAITHEVDGLLPNAGVVNFQRAVQNVKRFLSVCLVIASDKALSSGFSTIKQVASNHGVTSSFLINEDRAAQNGNPALRWNELFPGDVVLLPTGQSGAAGWFALPPTIQYADSRTTNLSYQQWVDAFVAGTLPQGKLDKVRDVTPLGNHELEHLVGQTCVAVAHKGISINYGPLNASLQGDRYGLFSFTVLGVEVPGSIPESGSSGSLKVLRVRIESPLTPTKVFNPADHLH